MCTLVLLRRPNTPWPLLMGANRDELKSRPWRPPARHWPDRPDVVAGQDLLAGGAWQGVNDFGVVAAVLNRVGSLGPVTDKRSRGELVLEALDHAEASAAAQALADIDPDAYRPFNLIVADRYDAYWLRHAGTLPDFGFRTLDGAWRVVDPVHMPHHEDARRAPRGPSIECHAVPQGLSMITARDLNDPASPRLAHYLPRFRDAPPPDPGAGDWSSWMELLASRDSPDGDPRNAMSVVGDGDYGTVCSSLLALAAEGPPRMLFAPGPPDRTAFEPIPV